MHQRALPGWPGVSGAKTRDSNLPGLPARPGLEARRGRGAERRAIALEHELGMGRQQPDPCMSTRTEAHESQP